jgi:DNA-directed RNA polymerase specialized sigma24 family protein
MARLDAQGNGVRGLVEQLAQTERCCVLLYYADDLTPREISAVLERPPVWVDGVLARFRTRAARVLGPSATTRPTARAA